MRARVQSDYVRRPSGMPIAMYNMIRICDPEGLVRRSHNAFRPRRRTNFEVDHKRRVYIDGDDIPRHFIFHESTYRCPFRRRPPVLALLSNNGVMSALTRRSPRYTYMFTALATGLRVQANHWFWFR